MTPLEIGIAGWLGGNVLLVPVMWLARQVRLRKQRRLLAMFERALQASGQREQPPV